MNLTVLQAASAQPGSANDPAVWVGASIASVILAISLWRIFAKASRPGWFAIIPVLNVLTLLRVAGRPWWWIILLCIPGVNVAMHFWLALSLGRAFDRGVLFSVILLGIFPVIGHLILGFGDSRYRGPR